MIIEPWIPILKDCPVVLIPKGTILFHGARRIHGEPLIQDQMFLTNSLALAEDYVRRDASTELVRSLIKFKLVRDVRVVDVTGIDLPGLSSAAQDKYGVSLVGDFDKPIRNHILETIRSIDSGLDGTISSGGNEFHFDTNLINLAVTI